MPELFFIPLAKAASSITQKSSETASQSNDAINQFFSFIWDKMDNWIAAVIVSLLSFYVAKLVKRYAVDKISQHVDEEHQDVLILAGRATYVAVVAVGLTVGLKIAGIDITAIVAAIGFGIGFALKDLIMNFAAGIMILLSRQFTLGDFISIGGTLGKVVEIQSRCTILQALDGTKVIVPNSDIFTKEVTSYTTNPLRRLDVNVGVEYSTDLKKAVDIALNTMKSHNDIILEPPPVVLVDQFADSSINLICRFWVESRSNWLGIRSQMIIDIKKSFDLAGISIPFPIRTLYFAKNDQNISQAMADQGVVPKAKVDTAQVISALQSNPVPQIEATQVKPEIQNSVSLPVVLPSEPKPEPATINNASQMPSTGDNGEEFLNKVQQSI